ncbi:hypothetical protein GCM10019016_119010 [Streptomyces prasinosporus]|uniref:Uncharacterized protein n=1 Tax=Streptomyces prasinosporus TaxID=68256 RepID=A0ABP6UDI0_9ACTN
MIEATASAGAAGRPSGAPARRTATAGVRAAAGVLRPVHGAAGGRVSPGAGPGLARGTAATVAGTGRPARPVDRPAPSSAAPAAPAAPADAGTGGRLNPAHGDTRSVQEPVAPGAVTAAPGSTPYATAGHGALRGVTDGDARAAVRRPGTPGEEAARPSAGEGAARCGDAGRDLLDAVTKSPERMGVDAE